MIPRLQGEQSKNAVGATEAWPLAGRILFRFGFCYFVLLIYPTILGGRSPVPFDQNNLVRKMWDSIVPWVGSRVLHLNGPFTPTFNDSGDQLYDYILWLCLIVTSAVLAAMWSLLDRNRKDYRVLYEWLRVLVRLSLAFAMINYGLDKLFRFQFPRLPLAKLVDTYGRSSPEGLLWAFMEYSRKYSFAGGLGEFTGGVLLVVPRLTALGALVTLGMMSNVLMLNFFYDVSRKILSIHLLLMSLFLLAPDLHRLGRFFLLNQKEQLGTPRPLFQEKRFNTAALLFQLAIGIGAIAYCAHHSYYTAQAEAGQVEASLRGIWNVEQFEYDGVSRLPLVTDKERWQYLIFDRPGTITIQLMDGTQQNFYVQRNQQTFSLWGTEDHARKGALSLQDLQSDHMSISGDLDKHRLNGLLRRVDLTDAQRFFLTNRSFRWVTPAAQIR